MKRDEFHTDVRARPGILQQLEKDADKMYEAAPDHFERTLFCFTSDPYQVFPPGEDVTRQALQIMVDRGLPFECCTKGGLRAERDFDLLKQGGRLGVSIAIREGDTQRCLEPYASDLNQRRCYLGIAKRAGLYVWVSVEPVIDADEALWAIQNAADNGVDEFRVGKLNPRTICQLPVEWQERVRAVDWQKFVDELMPLLEETGKAYYIKESLQPYLLGRPATGPDGSAP